jgi:hypothetical protein
MKTRIGLALVYLRTSLAMLPSAMLARVAIIRRGCLAHAAACRSEGVPMVCVSPRLKFYRNVLGKKTGRRACLSG